jgi:hypothetical protein
MLYKAIFIPLLMLVCASPTIAQERLILLGNSITWHTPNLSIGWNRNWGMAASKQDKDYVHQLAELLAKNSSPAVVYPRNISFMEDHTRLFDVNKIDFLATFNPTIVVVFLGDNRKNVEGSGEVFSNRYLAILSKVQKDTNASIYCVTTWWNNKATDKLIHKICNQSSASIVDISGISSIPGARADTVEKYENMGVASHPSDFGMGLIANRIFEKIASSNAKKSN